MDGIVYRIYSPNCTKSYYGSTTKDIHTRLTQHKSMYKLYLKGGCPKYSSFEVLSSGDNHIEVIKRVVCKNHKELRNAEKEIIQAAADAINKNIPNRDKKEYYKDNKDKYKLYYIQNRDKLLQYQNNYNKLIRAEQVKQVEQAT